MADWSQKIQNNNPKKIGNHDSTKIEVFPISDFFTNNDKNGLIIDLSAYQIDIKFLIEFANQVLKNRSIGQVILGRQNETRLRSTKCWNQICQHLAQNNRDFQRYPSDAVHCMLLCFFRRSQNEDQDCWPQLEQMGWSVKHELRIDDYVSILFQNELTRQLVLAFRGLDLDLSECIGCSEEFLNKLNENLKAHLYFSHLHTRIAFDLSLEMGYRLSFTGHVYAAWLAELAVFQCYHEFNTTNVRAVTFESPGCGEMLNRIVGSNHLDEILDIISYLGYPNFVNTSSKSVAFENDKEADEIASEMDKNHIGQLFFIDYEKHSEDKTTANIDDIKSGSSKEGHNEFLRSKLDSLKKSGNKFYTDALICLFSHNNNSLKRLLRCIGKNSDGKNEHFKKVNIWPKTRSVFAFEKVSLFDRNFDLKNLNARISTENNTIVDRKYLENIDERVFTNFAKIIEVQMSCISTSFRLLSSQLNNQNLDSCPSLDFIRNYDQTLFKGRQFSDPINLTSDQDGMKIEFLPIYEAQQLVKDDFKWDDLKNDELDSKLARFYFEIDTEINEINDKQLIKQFDELKNLFEISIEWNGSSQMDRKIKSKRFEIDRIRDRFARLNDLLQFNIARRNETSNSVNELWNPLETFVEPEENIFKHIDRILSTKRTLCLYGLPGSGKTTLAKEYGIYRKSPKKDFVFIESKTFEENIAQFKNRFLGSLHNLDEEELLFHIQSIINESNKDILFVFDDVKEAGEIEILTLLLDPRHKIIITTNNSELKDSIAEDLIELNAFSREKYREYFTKCLEIKKSRFRYTKNQLMRKDPLAIEIIKHLAYLDGRLIERQVIEEIFVKEDRKKIEKSLKYLKQMNYIEEYSEKKGIYEMSEIVQEEIVESLEETNEEREIKINLIKVFSSLMKKLAVLNQNKRVEAIQNNYNHLQKILNIKPENFDFKRLQLKLINVVKNTIDDCDFSRPEFQIEMNKKAKTLTQLFHNDKIHITQYISSTGLVCFNLGNLKRAEKNLNKNIHILIEKSRECSKHSLNLIESLIYLGLTQHSKGQYDRSLACFFQALEILKNFSRETEFGVAILYIYVGFIYHSRGDFESSLSYLFKSRDILEHFDELHPGSVSELAKLASYIGMVYLSMARYEQALDYFSYSYRILKTQHHDNHPGFAMFYNYVGLVSLKQGEYDKSLELFNKSIQIFIVNSMDKHSDLAMMHSFIGVIYFIKTDYVKASAAFDDSLRLFKANDLDKSHPNMCALHYYTGMLCHTKAEYDRALENFFVALRFLKDNQMADHQEIANVYNSIGMGFFFKGQFDKARMYFTIALRTWKLKKRALMTWFVKSSSVYKHPDIAQCYSNMGMVYLFNGEFEPALGYFFAALDIWRSFYGEYNANIAISYNNIGVIFFYTRRYERATKFFEDSLRVYRRVFGPSHPSVIMMQLKVYFINLRKVFTDSMLDFSTNLIVSNYFRPFKFDKVRNNKRIADCIKLFF